MTKAQQVIYIPLYQQPINYKTKREHSNLKHFQWEWNSIIKLQCSVRIHVYESTQIHRNYDQIKKFTASLKYITRLCPLFLLPFARLQQLLCFPSHNSISICRHIILCDPSALSSNSGHYANFEDLVTKYGKWSRVPQLLKVLSFWLWKEFHRICTPKILV